MFKFDEQEDWVDYTDSKSESAPHKLVAEVDFSRIAAFIEAESVMYITPWNILLCGVYKFHSERNLYDTIVTNVLEEEKKLVDLIDLVYRLGLPSREKSIDFREWHSTLPMEKRIPMEIFDENLRSHKLVLFIIKSCLLANDPDEKPRLVELQKQLVAKRNCICALGFHWDPSGVVSERLLGYCHEQNVCLNGGICQASVRKSTNRNALGVASEEIVILCTCSAAWRGETCELHGIHRICPPETHVRPSPRRSPPAAATSDELQRTNPELNSVVCEQLGDASKCILQTKRSPAMEIANASRIRRCESKGFGSAHSRGPEEGEIRFLCQDR
uniref:EGF-like domain-containing protein n=1 Tax=Macrostomum lignano TaxID=282301 RepID=A0A1I8FL19_9PLAT